MRIDKRTILVYLASTLLIALPFIYALMIYPDLADTIPVHFDINGKPDEWDNKSSIYLLPIIMGVVSLFNILLMTNLNRIDPKRHAPENDRLFSLLALFVTGFLSLLSLILEYQTLHPELPLQNILFPLIGLFFSGIGLFMPYLKQNYFAGFKFPWTLESNDNWEKTHKLGGRIWVAGGLIIMLTSSILNGKISFIIFITVVSLLVILPALISYRIFKREGK